MNTMTIHKIENEENKISYDYTVTGPWKQYFDMDNMFGVTYFNEDISEVDESIAVIPLVGNVLVLAAICDGKVYIEKLDQAFYNSVKSIIEGFRKVAKDVTFYEDILFPREIITNVPAEGKGFEAMYFSGGVDAWYTYLSLDNPQLKLVTVWGADIEYSNDEGWKKVQDYVEEIGRKLGNPHTFIKGNMRVFLRENKLNELSSELVDNNWWSAFQHSIGMLSLSGPICNQPIEKIYLAASFSDEDDVGDFVLASDPRIENNLIMVGTSIEHYGYDANRFQKIEMICNDKSLEQTMLPLRVCYETTKGNNCCECEKCTLTMMAIDLCGGDLTRLGFEKHEDLYMKFNRCLIDYNQSEEYAFYHNFSRLQKEMIKRWHIDQVPQALKVFYKSDFDELASMILVDCNEVIALKKKMEWDKEQLEAMSWHINHAKEVEKALQNEQEIIKDLYRQLEEHKEMIQRLKGKKKFWRRSK